MKTTLSTMFTSLSIEEADTCKSHMKDEDLLTLLSGGGGGKSSMSMLTALLLLKLFRHQHAEAQLHQRTFLQEERTNVITVSLRRLIQQKKESEFGISRSAYVSQSVHKRPTTCYSMLLNQSGRQQRGCVVTVCYLLYQHLILNQSEFRQMKSE